MLVRAVLLANVTEFKAVALLNTEAPRVLRDEGNEVVVIFLQPLKASFSIVVSLLPDKLMSDSNLAQFLKAPSPIVSSLFK